MRQLILLCVLFPVAACTSTEDMALLHREITDVQRQVQKLEASTLDSSDLAGMESKMGSLTAQTLRSNADLSMRVERLQEQIEALHANLELTTRRLHDIAQELAAARSRTTRTALPPVTVAGDTPTSQTTGPEAAPSEGEPAPPAAMPSSPDELYRSAYDDYQRGNFALAADGFHEYLKQWPDTELADNALYWIGECLDAQDMTQEAIDIFSQLLETYPLSEKAAAARLKKGLLYMKMDDQAQGVVQLQYVVLEYPGTEEADLARERLRTLGVTIR